MSSRNTVPLVSKTLLALAVAGAFGAARAQEAPTIEEAAAPPTSGTTVSVGIAHATGDSRDRARFGLFNGLRDHDTNLLLGFDYRNLNDATGTWTTLSG